jgi:hypothetical protein
MALEHASALPVVNILISLPEMSRNIKNIEKYVF